MVQMLDLADKDLKKAMINMLKGYNGKSGKHILTVKEFQQSYGVNKNEPNEIDKMKITVL